jgi:hypothetical protein
MRIRSLILIPAVLVLAVSCASLKTNDQGPPFYGMVYDMDNLPVQNARVFVDGKEAAGTDVNGRFVLSGLNFDSYAVELRKVGYESLVTQLDYFSSTQVLYVKMISADQLLGEAEAALAERRWEEASSLVDRAERTKPGAPVTLYLKAVVTFRRGDAQGARALLEGLLAKEYKEPAVYLLLADILQYRQDDPAGAAAHLRSYLKLRYDPEVEKRLAQLEKTTQANP